MRGAPHGVPGPGTLRRSDEGRGMSDSLATILTDTAAKHGDRVAFKLDDVELTYAMLDDGERARGEACCGRRASSRAIGSG